MYAVNIIYLDEALANLDCYFLKENFADFETS